MKIVGKIRLIHLKLPHPIPNTCLDRDIFALKIEGKKHRVATFTTEKKNLETIILEVHRPLHMTAAEA